MPRIIPGRSLDLDDISAHVGEGLANPRPGEDAREVENFQAVIGVKGHSPPILSSRLRGEVCWLKRTPASQSAPGPE